MGSATAQHKFIAARAPVGAGLRTVCHPRARGASAIGIPEMLRYARELRLKAQSHATTWKLLITTPGARASPHPQKKNRGVRLTDLEATRYFFGTQWNRGILILPVHQTGRDLMHDNTSRVEGCWQKIAC